MRAYTEVEKYNVIWNEPGKTAADSMPIGNGDMGLNVWTEENGDVLFYMGKTDTMDENARLLKPGRVRLHFSPSLLEKGMHFRQMLSLKDGEILLENEGLKLRVWVDANHPLVTVEGEADSELTVTASLELWRRNHPLMMEDKREGRLNGGSDASHSEQGMIAAKAAFPVKEDCVVAEHENVVWYHRNEESVWYGELKHQGLENFPGKDPLLYLTFGGMLWGDGFIKTSDRQLVCEPRRQFSLRVCLLTEQTDDAAAWVKDLEQTADDAEAIGIEERRQAHRDWWKTFWEKSYIDISAKGKDAEEARILSQMWHLQRYTVACAARGKYPLKFNGSIFNVDGNHDVENVYCHHGYDADFRAWGSCYWFQNQRQIYWAMLASGDFEQMLPFFGMYRDALPYAKYMTKTWFGHEGAFFPETMHFWGGYSRTDYGPASAAQKTTPSDVDSGYVKRYWQGGLELCFMMLQYYRYTEDKDFFGEYLLPVTEAVLTFYREHYPIDAEGKLRFTPAQALETIWNAVNPLPEIAGIRAVCEGLLGLSDTKLLTGEQKEECRKLLSVLPELTIRKDENGRWLDCCESSDEAYHNQENISMYAVFPYRLHGMGKSDLEMVRHTFDMRRFDACYSCWHNNNVFAAYLGKTEDARKHLAERYVLHKGYRFPTFYVDGDWVPDHDNGSVASQALQAMLLQENGEELLLFPAFPEEWDVSFRLCTAGNKAVEVSRVNGVVTMKICRRGGKNDSF